MLDYDRWSISDQKQLSGPVLPLREHKRPLTRLFKAIFTVGLGPMVWPHEAVDYSALKIIDRGSTLTSHATYWKRVFFKDGTLR